MKRVVIVSGDFPPSSLPSAQRMRFLAPHLAEFGWEPVVITTDPSFYEAHVDSENIQLLAKPVKIIRTPAISAKWSRKIGFGDIGLRGIWFYWKALNELCRNQEIDLVFITAPPYFPMILGRLAHERFRIPYVLDYQDPWVTDYYWKLPQNQWPRHWPLVHALSQSLEPFALKKVAHIVGVSQGTTDEIVDRYPWLERIQCSAIPLGGEPADFEYVRTHPRKNQFFDKSDGLFHLCYVGAYLPAMQVTLRAFFNAVGLGLQRYPDIFNRLRLHFIGSNHSKDSVSYRVLPFAREAKIEHLVQEYPSRVSYLDSLQILLDASGLVALGTEETHYTASKIFPFILARRPLLAIFHQASSVVQIMKETESGSVITFGSSAALGDKINEISDSLRTLLSHGPEYHPTTNWQAFEEYSARAMARRLATAFDRCSSTSNNEIK
jgi:hypothetical protein